jgi:hypothetical protein
VRFIRQEKALTQREFLELFANFDMFVGDVAEVRRKWATATVAAAAFRQAVLECSANGGSPVHPNGSVYWKGPGFSKHDLDSEFVAVCCGTEQPLEDIGNDENFKTNRDEEETEKVEFTHPHPERIPAPLGNQSTRKPGMYSVPGTHGFCKFSAGASTLVVPGYTRKHRAAWAPSAALGSGKRNRDGMAHLASAMKARNARVSESGRLVRDEQSQYLITDEEIAMGLRLVSQEVTRQLDTLAGKRVWWCTHGHDVQWLHFKVMSTDALLAKQQFRLKIKEQYTEEHLSALGFSYECDRKDDFVSADELPAPPAVPLDEEAPPPPPTTLPKRTSLVGAERTDLADLAWQAEVKETTGKGDFWQRRSAAAGGEKQQRASLSVRRASRLTGAVLGGTDVKLELANALAETTEGPN